MSFKNKVVIVTGASSGIGAFMAVKFAEEGAQVAMVGRNEQKLKVIAEKCEKVGSKPLVVSADISKKEDAERIINDTVKHFKKLDVLINNAGITVGTSILADNAIQVFDQAMTTNLRAVVHLTHLASKHLVATKGNIVNISSVTGLCVFTISDFCYGTSKAALDHFTRTVASELASKGVRVNAINPGPVNNGNEEPFPGMYERMSRYLPLGRMSTSEGITDLALFLASDKAASITGSSFVTDSGCMVKPVLNFAELAKA